MSALAELIAELIRIILTSPKPEIAARDAIKAANKAALKKAREL